MKQTRTEEVEWEGVDRGLFEKLRELRHRVASQRGVPAYVIFGDVTLRELARVRPGSLQSLINIRTELGEQVVEYIKA